jgi:hypothetical protein
MGSNLEKFSSQMDRQLLADLRKYARTENIRMSDILNEAVSTHLERVKLRPAFRSATEKVIEENRDLLQRLAK